MHVISITEPVTTVASGGDTAVRWVALDDRGIELEIVAVVLPDCWLVIHVMPTTFEEVNPE